MASSWRRAARSPRSSSSPLSTIAADLILGFAPRKGRLIRPCIGADTGGGPISAACSLACGTGAAEETLRELGMVVLDGVVQRSIGAARHGPPVEILRRVVVPLTERALQDARPERACHLLVGRGAARR